MPGSRAGGGGAVPAAARTHRRPLPQVHREKPALIFHVRQGRGQSEPGEYQHRLSLREAGAALALAHVTPHDERVFLCRAKRPGPREHRLQLRVYSECGGCGRGGACAVWAGRRGGVGWAEGRRGGGWACGLGRLLRPLLVSGAEAPEEPSIQANVQGISVNSPEPEEVRCPASGKKAEVGLAGEEWAGRLTCPS